MLSVWLEVDDLLVARGLERDVKTSYVSYTDRRSCVVAAVHPDPKGAYLEIALAIPETYRDSALYDSVHLRWRTLPRAARVSGNADVQHLGRLVDLALSAAANIEPRPSEVFVSTSRRLRRRASDPET